MGVTAIHVETVRALLARVNASLAEGREAGNSSKQLPSATRRPSARGPPTDACSRPATPRASRSVSAPHTSSSLPPVTFDLATSALEHENVSLP
jgi:hypothetical protein